jgi:hypothetical protein
MVRNSCEYLQNHSTTDLTITVEYYSHYHVEISRSFISFQSMNVRMHCSIMRSSPRYRNTGMIVGSRGEICMLRPKWLARSSVLDKIWYGYESSTQRISAKSFLAPGLTPFGFVPIVKAIHFRRLREIETLLLIVLEAYYREKV